ncbi:MAG: hypothetical protein Q4G69_05895 [Planctomycetia bacterium]|nr:hypothetical protein [Planctomycetia bacterium]
MAKKVLFGFLAGILFSFSGCGSSISLDNSPAPSTPAPNAKAPAAAPAAVKGEGSKEEVKAADVGATGKGKFADSAEKPMSVVTVPLATYFKAQEMVVFRMQIPEAMKLYKAENGENPKTQDEFMQKIIKANQIVLPTLPAGDSYFYDPSDAILKIKTKK